MIFQGSSFPDRVYLRVQEFLQRSELEKSTLTLDGTGVNGHIQFLTLRSIGPQSLQKFKRINLISGSFYSFLAYLAMADGRIDKNGLHSWDLDNRRDWHRTSFLKTGRRVIGALRKGGALYDPSCLERMFTGTTRGVFAGVEIKDLPKNISVWLYSLDKKDFVEINSESEYRMHTLTSLSRCCAAIPKIYGSAELGGEHFVDPVFSGHYAELRSRLRKEAKNNHLISNVVFDRSTPDTVWIKPHDFGRGQWMVAADFLRMLFNIRNRRIANACQIAFTIGAP